MDVFNVPYFEGNVVSLYSTVIIPRNLSRKPYVYSSFFCTWTDNAVSSGNFTDYVFFSISCRISLFIKIYCQDLIGNVYRYNSFFVVNFVLSLLH
jgi:hypothetical protein